MKKIYFFILVFLCSIVFIAACNGSDTGSAANDPNAYRINGLLISLDENVWDLVSYDGSKVHVSADEVVSGEFKMLGKLTSVTLTLNHGF